MWWGLTLPRVLRVKKNHLNKVFWEALQIIMFENKLEEETRMGK